MSPLRSEVERLATIVESDALAMTYQSLGQYRRDLLEVIRGVLAQPEEKPVAWQSRYIGRGEPFGEWRTIEWPLEECANLTRGAVEHMRAQTDFEVRPLYAHPPRDEWRLASEPPETTRSVLVWLRFGDVETFGKTLGGSSGFSFQNGAITHWRDVQPPTEAPAQCQRVESDGRPCGLTPPCPDCGPSLIDFPEGSL